jgi:hypothetical protein
MTRIADTPTDPAEPPGPEPVCPPDWRTGPPDFVGIGAYRSGTTWLYEMIVAHPDVAVPPGRPKELHFFKSFWEGGFTPADVTRYHRYFPRPAGKLVGECTPRYMFDSWTPRMLAAAAPEARLLVILRDPVSRYVSHLARQLGPCQPGRAGRGPAVAGIAIARSLYMTQLRAVLLHFPREQLLVVQLERCMLDPEAELRRTYGFLGLDQSFVPPDPGQKVHAGGPIELEAEMLEDVAQMVRADAAELARSFPEIELSLWPSLQRRS